MAEPVLRLYFFAMKRQILRYTFIVWLCSAAISPSIAAILQFYYDQGDTSKLNWLAEYPLILFFELLLTSPLWALFWAFTETSGNFFREDKWVRWISTLSSLAIASTICLYTTSAQCSLDDQFFTITLGNSFCFVFGCWYFDVSKPIPRSNAPALSNSCAQ